MKFFNKRKYSKVVQGSAFEDVPTPAANELFVVPATNILLHPKLSVYPNRSRMPDWYKHSMGGESGIKRCYGLADYLRTGYTVPMWAKLDIRPPLNKLQPKWEAKYDFSHGLVSHELMFVDEQTEDEFFSANSLFHNQFGQEQVGECPVSKIKTRHNSAYLKLTNPWLFKTAPGYSTLFIAPQWSPNPNYQVMSGVVNTDYYHHANVVLNITSDSEFSIEEGTPMLHAIPFKREDGIKGSELIRGDENLHKVLDGLGFLSVRRPTDWKGMYKREQAQIDRSLKENPNG
jgi:hypothetical protein